MMNQEKNQEQRRKSIRLKDYDYSQAGAYFVTIVTQSRKHFFGEVCNNEMVLNSAGKMVVQVCSEIEGFFDQVTLGPLQVMPNHLHAIINIGLSDWLEKRSAEVRNNNMTIDLGINDQRPSLSDLISRLKNITTYRYIQGVKNDGWPRFSGRLWQRSYYDHVIRDEQDYEVITDYIQSNPLNWGDDEENKKGARCSQGGRQGHPHVIEE